jgi:EAL domain-containing protein (putative c-di-GMP-specific phosphodiesterase class I)
VALSSGDDHPEALLRDADAAMYRAKDLGRARLELFDETMRSRASNRVQLTEELRHAVASGAITVHYQPSIDLRTGRVRSVESLARWQHPERGLLQPGEFIGVADSSGLVLELGLEVLRQACRKARSWQDRWGAAAPRMHVNLSGRQVADPELARLVAYVLAETRVDPRLICLELTESILLDDSEAAIEAIRGLKDLGISLAIDDFGTGYSSLSYLSRLPVDVVKVDKAFVDDLDPADGDGPVVAAAIISLARTRRLGTIAEGVTTVVQLAELHRLGCDAAQGYYFSPPLDAREIELYLERRLSGDGDDTLPADGGRLLGAIRAWGGRAVRSGSGAVGRPARRRVRLRGGRHVGLGGGSAAGVPVPCDDRARLPRVRDDAGDAAVAARAPARGARPQRAAGGPRAAGRVELARVGRCAGSSAASPVDQGQLVGGGVAGPVRGGPEPAVARLPLVGVLVACRSPCWFEHATRLWGPRRREGPTLCEAGLDNDSTSIRRRVSLRRFAADSTGAPDSTTIRRRFDGAVGLRFDSLSIRRSAAKRCQPMRRSPAL